MKGDRVHFIKEKKEMNEIPSLRMINTALDYATELNRIVWAISRHPAIFHVQSMFHITLTEF